MYSHCFDNPPSRIGTTSFKWGLQPYPINPESTLHPHWVADMDFQCCPAIIEAIKKEAERGIYGYSNKPKELFQHLATYLNEQGMNINEEYLQKNVIFTPGVVAGVGLILTMLTEKGDAVIFQTPSYPHFFESVGDLDRKVVNNKMKYVNGRWEIDFEDFEQKIIEHKVKAYILCSPHNPTGRVFDKEELEKLILICRKHDVLIISDEIHCDLLLTKKHIHTQTLCTKEDKIITMLAPSKTYNIPGLALAFMLVENEEYQKKIKFLANGISVSFGTLFGFTGMNVAYSGACKGWLEECLQYLRDNVKLITEFCNKHLPSLKITQPEATYLLWMDLSAYGLSTEEIDKKLGEKGIIFNQGPKFGEGFELFRRFNIATPRKEIQTVLDLLLEIFKPYEKEQ